MRRLILPALAAIAVAETYRRGYIAPVLFGVRLWVQLLDPRTITEPDPIG